MNGATRVFLFLGGFVALLVSVTCASDKLDRFCELKSCDTDSKRCDVGDEVRCVDVDDAAYGCGSQDGDCAPCSVPHAFASTCDDGECVVPAGSCVPGYQNCTHDEKPDGCETNTIEDSKNCGECGHDCSKEPIESTVGTVGCAPGKGGGGECVMVFCPAPFSDCNGKIVDGCEADLRLKDNCGACDNVCAEGQNCVSRCSDEEGCVDFECA